MGGHAILAAIVLLSSVHIAHSVAASATGTGSPTPSVSASPAVGALVTTLAGCAANCSVGAADGAASSASFYNPVGVAVTSTGTVYVADGSLKIRAITAGVVSTFAGCTTQTACATGAVDGAASSASFWYPAGIAVSSNGTVYFADMRNEKIRTITAGVVSTFAGCTTQAACAVGAVDGAASSASFNSPWGVAVSSTDTVYVADIMNSKIRAIIAGVVSTFAGCTTQAQCTFGAADGTASSASFNRPRGVAVSSTGTVYVADMLNYKIRAITAGGVVSTFAGCTTQAACATGATDGAASSASFDQPFGVAVTSTGTVYVVEYNHKVRAITAGVVSTFAGCTTQAACATGAADGVASSARFRFPISVAVSSTGTVYVADLSNNKLRAIVFPSFLTPSPSASLTLTPTTSPTPTSSPTRTQTPTQTSTAGGTPSTTPTFSASQTPSQTGTPSSTPTAAAASATGTGSPTPSVSASPASVGTLVTTLAGCAANCSVGAADGAASSASFFYPVGVAVLSTGTVYVADVNNHKLRAITAGVVSTFAGCTTQAACASGAVDGASSSASFNFPESVAVSSAGTVYVSDTYNNKLRAITAGVVSTFAGCTTQAACATGAMDGASSSARFNFPRGIAVSSSGTVYIADGNQNIRAVTAGVVSTIAGCTTQAACATGATDGAASSASFNRPIGVAVSSTGTVYVADYYNHKIRTITTGMVSTFAGCTNQTVCATGAVDGAASSASFNYPFSLAVSSTGIVYVADEYNNKLRAITAGVVSTFAGCTTQAACATEATDGAASSAGFYSPIGVAVSSAGTVFVADYYNQKIRAIVPLLLSPTPAASPTLTTTPTPTCTTTVTPQSPLASVSLTRSPSETQTTSCTPTSTPMGTTTTTPLPQTQSSAPTESPSQSPTPSRTPAPLSCGASPAGCLTASLSALVLAAPAAPLATSRLVLSLASPHVLDTFANTAPQPLPPYASAQLRLVLPGVPSPNEMLSIACSSASPGNVSVSLSAPATSAAASMFTFSSPSSLELSFQGVALSAWNGGLDFPVNVAVRAASLIVPLFATLTCALTSQLTSPGAGGVARVYPRYPPSSIASLSVILLPPALPLSYDVLLELPSALGSFKSSWSGTVTALSSLSLLGVNASGSGTGGGGSSSSAPTSSSTDGSGVLSSYWTNGSVVLASPSALLALSALALLPPPATAASTPWALTLSGSAHLILVASSPPPASAGPAFSNTTTASVGGIAASVNWVSPDGTLLSITTPPFAALCSATGSSGVCGSRALVVGSSLSPATTTAAVAITTAPDDTALTAALATLTFNADVDIMPRPQLSCPPACPTDWLGAFSAAVPADGASLLYRAARAAASPPPTSTLALDVGAGGIYVVAACAGFPSPATGVCSNASSPIAPQCAWGVGDTCQLCPLGALCPGGARLWPRPGYWAASQDAIPSDLVPCATPATERCPGASSAGSAAGAFPCGVGYRTGTIACTGCDSGYFPSGGICSPCAPSSMLRGIILPVLYLIAGALAACVVFTLLVYASVRKRNGTLRGSFIHTVQLVVWLWVALQVLVQVARSAQSNAPPALASFFSALTALQFQGLALDPACVSLSAFASTWAQFALVTVCVGLIAAHVVVTAVASACGSSVRFSGDEALALSAVASAVPAVASGGTIAPAWPAGDNNAIESPDRVKPTRNRNIPSPGCMPQARSNLLLLAAFSVKLLVVLYALITNTTLAALTCTVTPLTVRGYLVLSQDGTTLLAAANAGAFGSAADAAILAPGSYITLLAYNSGTVAFATLPPALAAVAPMLLSSPLSVSVLASNPYIVCRERDHVRVVACAWAVFVLFCLAFPLVCAAWTAVAIDARMGNASIVGEAAAVRWAELRSAWLARMRCVAEAIAFRRSCCGGGCRVCALPLQHTPQQSTGGAVHPATAMSSGGAVVSNSATSPDGSIGPSAVSTNASVTPVSRSGTTTVNPLLRLQAASQQVSTTKAEGGVGAGAALSVNKFAPLPSSTAAHGAIDAAPAATATPFLRALTAGDTRPSYFYFSTLDQAVLLILAVPVAYNTQASGLSGRPLSLLLATQAGALAASLIATFGAAYAIVRAAPYPREFAWKAWGKVYIYFLAAGSSIVNFLTWWQGVVAEGRASSFDALPGLVRVLSLVLLAAAAALLLFLAVSFVVSLLAEGRAEGAAALTGRSEVSGGTASTIIEDPVTVVEMQPPTAAPTPSYTVLPPSGGGGHLWRRVAEADGDVWWACDATGESSWDAPRGATVADGWVRVPLPRDGEALAASSEGAPAVAELPSDAPAVDSTRRSSAGGARSGNATSSGPGDIRDHVRELVASLKLSTKRHGVPGSASH